MKVIFFILFFYSFSFQSIYAQVIEEIELEDDKSKLKEPLEGCYYPLEVPPAFPGGEKAFHEFLDKNLDGSCMDSCGEGRSYATFFIDTTGSVVDIQIVRSFCKKCDEEIIRVISLMPKWIPGRMGRKIVKVRYQLPIIFKKK